MIAGQTSPSAANDMLMADDPGPSGAPQSGSAGPYGHGAAVYGGLEYTGIVPVRRTGDKAKTIARKRVSGRKGVQTLPKHYTGPNALPRYAEFNIGWRMPYGMIGIDIDQYDGKTGADDLKELEADLGPLPDTWSSTARGDGPSRIYFYRVPEDCGELAGSLSKSIEVIQRHHRYAIIWPSVHSGTGNTYAWYNGVKSDHPPTLDQFAELPAAWLEHLSKTQREHREGAGLGVEEFRQRYTEEADPDLVRRIRDRFDSEPSCRHDSMVKAVGWVCRAATYGLVNAGDVFDLLAADWDAATDGEGRQDEFDALLRDMVRDTPEPDEAKDDEYEPEEDPARDEPVFGPEIPKEVKIEALRILRHQKAMEIVRTFQARQDTDSALTVSDALDELLGGEETDVPSVAEIEGHERGWGLFYPGQINGIYGDESVGKSVIMAEIQARVLRDGGTVVHWEFDNNPLKSILKRLLYAGARPDDIRGRFHALFDQGAKNLLPEGVRTSAALVTLDALNPAAQAFNADPYHPGGIDTVLRECLRPFTLNGACGVLLDHVGHENKERQAGSIRKSQAIQGALYEAYMVSALKPGATGQTRLVLRKDNRGSLGETGRSIALAVMASDADAGGLAGRVRTVFSEPDPFNGHEAAPPPDTRPVDNVQRIVQEMDRAGLPSDLSQRAARDWLKDHGVDIPGKATDWRSAHAARQAQHNRSSGGS